MGKKRKRSKRKVVKKRNTVHFSLPVESLSSVSSSSDDQSGSSLVTVDTDTTLSDYLPHSRCKSMTERTAERKSKSEIEEGQDEHGVISTDEEWLP